MLRRVIALKDWTPDEETDECMSCDTPFSCCFRRHHCRFCGLVICGACSSKTIHIEGAEQRCCQNCWDKDQKSSRSYQVLSSSPHLSKVQRLSPRVCNTRKLTDSPLVSYSRRALQSMYGDGPGDQPRHGSTGRLSGASRSTTPSSRARAPDEEKEPRKSKGVVIVIDPFSTGAVVAAEILRRGFEVLRVYSAVFPEHIMNLTLDGVTLDFVASVNHMGNLEQTVLAVQACHCKLIGLVSGCETGVELGDALSEALGLRGNGTKFTDFRRHKYHMGEKVRQAGVRAVRQAKANTWAEIKAFINKEWGNTPLLCVIKPCESAGSDGVYKCESIQDLEAKFKLIIGATNILGNNNTQVVVQEFLEGIEYVVDTVSYEGIHKVAAIWKYDKRAANGVNFIYFGMRLMAGDDPISQELIVYQKQVLDALGIRNGPGHGEVIMTPTGPCLVEVGARPHGGEGSWVSMADKVLGYNQVRGTVTAVCSPSKFKQIPDIPVLQGLFGLELMLVSRTEGILEDYPRLEEVKALPSYFEHFLLINPGDKLPLTLDCISRPGSIRLVHKSQAQVEEDFLKIRAMELDQEKPFYLVRTKLS